MNFSIYNSSFEKNFKASSLASLYKSVNDSLSSTRRIPFPPPPADALIKTGNPIASAQAKPSSNVTALWEPGTTGTPAQPQSLIEQPQSYFPSFP